MAACIALMIPVTVWAAESIFGVTLISQLNGKVSDGIDLVGYQGQVENVGNIPMTELSQHLQELKETEVVYFDSWEEAEQEVGINLISNNILTDEGTKPSTSCNFFDNAPPLTHCQGLYHAANDQLLAVEINAQYFRNNIRFFICANMTANNPQMTEEQFQLYHGFAERYYPSHQIADITVERFTTKNGIPVTIFCLKQNDYLWPRAYISVNNVSYELDIDAYYSMGDETIEMENERGLTVFRDVLEGFTLE